MNSIQTFGMNKFRTHILRAASSEGLHSFAPRSGRTFAGGTICPEEHSPGVSELLSSNIQETGSHQQRSAAQTISGEQGISKQGQAQARPREHGTAELSSRHKAQSADNVKQCDGDDSREKLGGSTWNGTLLEHGDMHVVEASTEEPTRSHLRATCDHASRKTQQRGVNLAVPI